MLSQQLAQPLPANQERTSPDINSMDQRTLFYISLPLLLIAFFGLGGISYDYKIAWQILVLGFVLGLIAGTLVGLPITKKELNLLSQKGKISRRILKLSFLSFIVAFIGIFLILFFVYYSGLEVGIFFDIGLGVVSFRFSNFIQCFGWENASKKRIYAGAGEIYVISKTEQQQQNALQQYSYTPPSNTGS